MNPAERPVEADSLLTLLFEAGGVRYSLPASAVHKVVDIDYVRFLVGLPAGVLGISHHHGHILTVIDLEAALTAGGALANLSAARVLVLERPARHLALRADAVEQICALPSAAPPAGDELWTEVSLAGSTHRALAMERLIPFLERLHAS